MCPLEMWDNGILHTAYPQAVPAVSQIVFTVQTDRGSYNCHIWQMSEDMQVDILTYCAHVGWQVLKDRHGIVITE